jgi:hypothetical protein
MNFSSCILVFFCFLFSVSCVGQNIPPQKELSKTEANQKEKQDSCFQYFVGKHPEPKQNSLYFEIFGSSANIYSLNYDRCFYMHKRKREKWSRYSFRIGINYFVEKCAIPLMIHFSTGREYCFEAGAGWVPWLSDKKRVDGVAAFTGFRFQPKKTGMMARFGLTPTYMVQEKSHWRMIYGFSFGLAF